MTLHIKDPKADRLARELAKVTGESLTDAVTRAVEERLARQTSQTNAGAQLRFDRVMKLLEEFDKLPVYDNRSADEILGYDENGLPT
jgi:antitoxin VapB